MTERNIREIFIGKESGRHYYEVGQADAGDMAADEHEAIVVVASSEVRCYRCDTRADVVFKCIHIHAVRRTLDI